MKVLSGERYLSCERVVKRKMKIFIFALAFLTITLSSSTANAQLPPGARREPCTEIIMMKALHAEQLARKRSNDRHYSGWSETESAKRIKQREEEFSKECGKNEKREISR
ncbi:hypothetical protein EGT07_14850 [Herbaspirillum sp. HC18]|nr:hypothetical protein EGT07_14850 [Herbaspirillum sp. HC18]